MSPNDSRGQAATASRRVDIVAFNALIDHKEVQATCRLAAGAATVELSGQPHLVERLKTGVYSPQAGREVRPEDGAAFLDAVLVEFRNAYMFAEEVRDQTT